jgi:hypothetical protein
MENLLVAWRFLLLAGVFVFPQLLGVLLYFRLSRAPRWLAFTAAALIPAIVFFWLAPNFFFGGFREAYARGERGCGMPAMAAAFLFLAGTVIQLGAGLFTQIILSTRRRRKAAASKGEQ